MPLAALASAFAAWAIHRNGLGLSVDAWSYWESSVSLLAGAGLRYLGGEAMPWWPPLFPAYLAAIQALVGVSGASLARALELLAAAGTLAWLRLVMPLQARPPLASWLAASALVAFFASASRALYSETLMLPVLAVAIVRFDEIGRAICSTRRQVGMATLTVAAGLLTRHSFVTFVPGLLVLTLSTATDSGSRLRALGRALLASVLGLSIYFAVRFWLGQTGSHPFEPFAAGVFFAEVRTAGRDLARQLAPNPLGLLLIGAILGAALLFFLERPANEVARRARWLVVGCLACALSGIVGQAALLGLVRSSVTESMVGRYLWFVLPLAISIASIVATSASARWIRRLALLSILLMAAVEIRRAAYWMLNPEPAGSASLLQPDWTLSVDHPCATGAAIRLADGRALVAPPAFEWLERCKEISPPLPRRSAEPNDAP